jgi:predicted DNA-binding transcriptional regulator AlpA
MRGDITVQQDILLTERETANLLKISQRTLQAWRCKGYGPPFIRVGRSVRYCVTDVKSWMDLNRSAVP